MMGSGEGIQRMSCIRFKLFPHRIFLIDQYNSISAGQVS